ncbi:MAG: hypothetical protein R6U96_00715 [Promethearchaeia archaeon]
MKNEENKKDLDINKERDKLDQMGAKSTWDLLEEKKKEESDSNEKQGKNKPFT